MPLVPFVIPSSAVTRRRRPWWIDADGVSLALHGGPVWLGRGHTLWSTPGARVESFAAERGRHVGSISTLTRVLAVPIVIADPDPLVVEAQVEVVADAFDPARGKGRLRVQRMDGSMREIVAVPDGALSFPAQLSSPEHVTAVVTLEAFDPDWIAVDPSTWVLSPGSPGQFFPVPHADDDWLPLLSLRLFAADVIVNSASLPAWPVWTITGPCSAVRAENVSTGKAWSINRPLLDTETLVVDTQPGSVDVSINGVPSWSAMGDDRTLWSLLPGSNSVRIEAEATGASSSVLCQFRMRWRMA